MDTFVFPAFIEGDARDGYSAFFPDLPGCTTAAATMTGLAPAAREALELHLKGMREDGQAIPDATAVEALQREPETANAPVILVDATVGEPRLRINITIGRSLLARVDHAAQAEGLDRSAFLEAAARVRLEGAAERQVWKNIEREAVADFTARKEGWSVAPAASPGGWVTLFGAHHHSLVTKAMGQSATEATSMVQRTLTEARRLQEQLDQEVSRAKLEARD